MDQDAKEAQPAKRAIMWINGIILDRVRYDGIEADITSRAERDVNIKCPCATLRAFSLSQMRRAKLA